MTATADKLNEQAEIILSTEALGRSPALERLFRFLLACSLEGRSPKEVEIADEVFGRSVDSNDQDASIRVHIHRLRRKLEEYYAGPGAASSDKLTIPKGSYRLIVETAAPVVPATPTEVSTLRRLQRLPMLAIVGAAALLIGILFGAWLSTPRGLVDIALGKVQNNILWRSAASAERPVIIVVGDYYIFGERDSDGQVTRLVREFNVNSARDLEELKTMQPERAANYVDLGLNYFPVGVGNALRRVIPVVSRDKQSLTSMRVIPASALTPEMLKFNDIVYVGYLSGLGSLRDPVFNGSRFAIGGSYDELVDRKSGKHYVSGSHLESDSEALKQDYALVSTFKGLIGNRIVVIAGTRDAALMQAAEFVTKAQPVADMTAKVNDADAFEALLMIESMKDQGLLAHVVTVAPRPADADWSSDHAQSFPDDIDSMPATASMNSR